MDDDIIPHSHSKTLFYHLLSTASEKELETTERNYPGWGRTSQFDRGSTGGEVIWWEGLTGGHNKIGWAEGTIELIKQVAKL